MTNEASDCGNFRETRENADSVPSIKQPLAHHESTGDLSQLTIEIYVSRYI